METLLSNISGKWEDLLWLGVIMVSAITVLIGILKPFVFNKIKWKPLRRALLAFSNVALCFVSTVVLFEIEHYSYDMYWYAASAVSVFSILWYWVYENTCLRDLIDLIGKMTLKAVYKVVDKKDAKAIAKELSAVKKTLKAEAKSAVKNAKVDKELKDL